MRSDRLRITAALKRVKGLLWLDAGKRVEAREALRFHELRFGPDHWRVKRAREELANAPST